MAQQELTCRSFVINSHELVLLGFASSFGASMRGCEKAPDRVKKLTRSRFAWQPIIRGAQKNHCSFRDFSVALERLSEQVCNLVRLQQRFVVIGGDHACAMGTWKGAMRGLEGRPMGLLWVDAHMDSHSFETSPSDNLHGMPVASLLGGAELKLNQLGGNEQIAPENLCFYGARSYEKPEKRRLKNHAVKVVKDKKIHKLGVEESLVKALKRVSRDDRPFGISIDLDAFKPEQVIGTGTPVDGGIDVFEFCRVLGTLDLSRCIGVEIVEFNPDCDVNNQTIGVVLRLLHTLDLTFKRSVS